MVREELKGKRILVTGAFGFVGLNLLSSLQGENVVSTDILPKEAIKSYLPIDPDTYHRADLTDRPATLELVRQVNPDYIVHLAASTDLSRTFDAVYRTLEINTRGTLHLFEAALQSDVKHLIFLSTSDVYGEVSPPFHEEMPVHPASPYSVTKASVEMYARMLHRTNNLPVTILRSFNLYGPMQKPIRLIPFLIRNLLLGNEVPLTKGEQKREYNHVNDLIDVILKLLPREDTFGEVFNVGCGRSYPIREVAERIGDMLGGRHLLKFGELPYRANEIWDMYSSSKKLKDILGWESNVSFEDGLRLTVDWYRQNLATWSEYLVGTAT